MIKIKIKTLSLLYDAREDRMKLIINKEEEDRIAFWITRRFYFSLLFELETFLEQLQITPQVPVSKKVKSTQRKSTGYTSQGSQKLETADTVTSVEKKLDIPGSLVENINISFMKEREAFVFVFQSNKIEAESIFTMDQFLDFYTILKSSFPKGEWGII